MVDNADLDDIPGTTVFTADRSRQGFQLNQFCMSLMKPASRERFSADERGYLDEWELAAHLAQCLILDEFDLALMNKLDVDHGLTVPLSLVYGQVQQWPVRVIPLVVNVVQYPPPTGRRCLNLGRAVRRAVHSYPEDLGPGLGHRRDEPPDPGRASRADQQGVRPRVPGPLGGRPGGAGRTALGPEVKQLHRFYHVPASNTAAGHVVLEPTAG